MDRPTAGYACAYEDGTVAMRERPQQTAAQLPHVRFSLPGTVRGRESTPGSAGGHAPKDGGQDAAVVAVGAPSVRVGRWQQGRQLLPLAVSERVTLQAGLVSNHARFATTP